jgi:hypothetical protein
MPNSSLNINFKSLFDWKGILLIIFILFITFMQCNQKNDSSKDIITIDKKKYQIQKKSSKISIKQNSFVFHRSERDIYTYISDYDTIYTDVDTNAILKDYFAKVVSIDTLKLNDSLGYITILDTISKNRIQYRTYFANVNQKEIHDTIWIDPIPKPNLYFGINGGFTKNQLPNTIGVSLLYQSPNNVMYGLGVGLQNGAIISPYINGTVYWKIKLKK